MGNYRPVITHRIRGIPEYVELFKNAFDDVNSPLDIHITHILNSIAAFEIHEWTSFDSPFDEYLNGDKQACLSPFKYSSKGESKDVHS